MEGFSLRGMKPVGGHLLVNHQMIFTRIPGGPFGGPPQPHSVYQFGAILLPHERKQTMIRADIDNDLNVTARGALEILPWLVAKTNLQLAATNDPGAGAYELSLTAQQENWNAKVLTGSGGYFQTSAFARVTERLALGAEAFYVGQAGGKPGGLTGAAVSGRYAGVENVVTATVSSPSSAQLTWMRRYGEKVNLWSSLDLMRMEERRDAVCAAGYDATFRMARVRGSLDTKGVMRMVLEEKLTPGLTLTLACMLDHAKGDHKFGMGFASDPM
jgi:hypothetical protein